MNFPHAPAGPQCYQIWIALCLAACRNSSHQTSPASSFPNQFYSAIVMTSRGVLIVYWEILCRWGFKPVQFFGNLFFEIKRLQLCEEWCFCSVQMALGKRKHAHAHATWRRHLLTTDRLSQTFTLAYGWLSITFSKNFKWSYTFVGQYR